MNALNLANCWGVKGLGLLMNPHQKCIHKLSRYSEHYFNYGFYHDFFYSLIKFCRDELL